MTAAADGGLVLATTRSFGTGSTDPAALLREAGLELVRGPPDHDLAALRPVLADAVAWIAGTAPVTDEHLAAAPGLRILARYGTGTDAVDVEAAARRGVVVTNTPGANAEAVADHTVGLMLACLRHIVGGHRAAHAGQWPSLRGRELGGCTVGLVGFGHVGRAVAARLRGFGSSVLVHDPFVDAAAVEQVGARPVALPELAAAADVVSLHRPAGGPPVVDGAFLRDVRPGAVLVNTARAELVDESAVAAALADGTLAAVGTDVLARTAPPRSPLLGMDGVVVTPHVAAQTVEAIDRMGADAVAEVLRVVVAGRPPAHPVTVPETGGVGT